MCDYVMFWKIAPLQQTGLDNIIGIPQYRIHFTPCFQHNSLNKIKHATNRNPTKNKPSNSKYFYL